MASLQVETPALNEPVDMDTLKNHLRVTIANDDALIAIYLQAARELVEGESGRSLVNKVYRQSHDRFPRLQEDGQAGGGFSYLSPRYANRSADMRQAIKLLRAPLVSVSRITYIDTAGVLRTLSPTVDFLVDGDSEPPRLMPLFSQSWPATLRVPNAVQIFFTAGYGDDGADAPATLKVAVMMTVGVSYEFREAVTAALLRELDWYNRLIYSERVMDFNPTK